MPNVVIFVVVAVGCGWGVLHLFRRMAWQALNPTFSWTPPDPARGEGIDVNVQVECSKVVHVRAVEAHLLARRYAYAPPSDDSLFSFNVSSFISRAVVNQTLSAVPTTDVCSHTKVALCHEMMFNPGEPMQLVGQLDVPFDALPTHTSGRLQIRWFIQIQFLVANFPPLVLERELTLQREPVGRAPRYRTPHMHPAAAAPLLDDGPSLPSWPPHPPVADRPVNGTAGSGPHDMFAHLELDVERQDPPP